MPIGYGFENSRKQEPYNPRGKTLAEQSDDDGESSFDMAGYIVLAIVTGIIFGVVLKIAGLL